MAGTMAHIATERPCLPGLGRSALVEGAEALEGDRFDRFSGIGRNLGMWPCETAESTASSRTFLGSTVDLEIC